MMDEKTMVSDTLTGINGELKMYAEYISQSEDPKLKQTLKQMRNKAEAVSCFLRICRKFCMTGLAAADQMTKILYIQF